MNPGRIVLAGFAGTAAMSLLYGGIVGAVYGAPRLVPAAA